MPNYPPRRVALVGLMGAGKTVLARAAGARLGWPVLDADGLLEERAGTPVAGIFAREGERGFRSRERRLLAELAGSPAPFLLATGGGVVEEAANRRRLREDFWTVWLRIDPGVAAARLGRDETRPLLASGDPASVLRELDARRAPAYREVSRALLDAGLPLEAQVDALLEALLEPGRGPVDDTI